MGIVVLNTACKQRTTWVGEDIGSVGGLSLVVKRMKLSPFMMCFHLVQAQVFQLCTEASRLGDDGPVQCSS